MADMPILRLIDIHKSFAGTEVLKGVSLDARKGEVICLLGPSGAGKSTLLRCINMIERPDRGLVLLDGNPFGCREEKGRYIRIPERALSRQRADIGMVFQSFNLFPHMTVLGNIIDAPMRVRGQSRAEALDGARALLERVGLADRVHSYPRELSGGQQQRIAIARALAMNPKLMLFDEPTSALDPQLTEEVLAVMRDLAASGMTMIVVTHEIGFAREVADRVVVMADGRIVETGAPAQVLDDPTDPLTRGFLARRSA